MRARARGPSFVLQIQLSSEIDAESEVTHVKGACGEMYVRSLSSFARERERERPKFHGERSLEIRSSFSRRYRSERALQQTARLREKRLPEGSDTRSLRQSHRIMTS